MASLVGTVHHIDVCTEISRDRASTG